LRKLIRAIRVIRGEVFGFRQGWDPNLQAYWYYPRRAL
jgi:hypothetical protein